MTHHSELVIIICFITESIWFPCFTVLIILDSSVVILINECSSNITSVFHFFQIFQYIWIIIITLTILSFVYDLLTIPSTWEVFLKCANCLRQMTHTIVWLYMLKIYISMIKLFLLFTFFYKFWICLRNYKKYALNHE